MLWEEVVPSVAYCCTVLPLCSVPVGICAAGLSIPICQG